MFNFLKRKKQADGNKPDPNIYEDMREIAFSIIPDQLGVTLDNDEQVYGAVIDMAVGDGNVATMTCFIDGSASLYFSTGGGIIGTGQHENAKHAAGSFLISVHQVLFIYLQL